LQLDRRGKVASYLRRRGGKKGAGRKKRRTVIFDPSVGRRELFIILKRGKVG